MTTSATLYTPKKSLDVRGCILSIVGTGEEAPAHFLSSIRQAGAAELAVFGGGCKFFTPDMVAKLAPWVTGGFTDKFVGVAMSGGTANVDKDGKLLTDMVTSIPPILAAQSECVAIGTFPRVYEFALSRETNHLLTDNYGAVVDNRYHHTAAVQKNASEVLDWDGDLKQRFAIIDLLSDWTKAYVIINGGGVTRDEAYMAIRAGIPVIVARGSKREADALVAALDGDWSLTAKEERDKATGKLEGAALDAAIAKIDGIVDTCKQTLEGKESLVNVVDYGDEAGLTAKLRALGFSI